MSRLAADTAAKREALAAVYRYIPRSIWFTLLVAWAIAYFLAGHASGPGVWWWAIAMTLVGLLRLARCLRRASRPDFLVDAASDARELTLLLLVHGLGFAAGFLLFALDAPLALQYAFILCVVGLSGGAVTVLTGCRVAYLAYSAPMVVTVTVSMLWLGLLSGDAERTLLGAMLVVYAGAIAFYQLRLERRVLDSIRLRHEQVALLAQKEALLEELRQRNEALSADREAFLTASLTDGLTGLANRRHFDRTLVRDWKRNRRDGVPLACILMDIDHFKNYNDRYGHMAGDDCLRAIARVIASTVSRGGDFAARYGGEEFVVLLPGTGAAGARLLAERIRERVEACAIPHAGGGEGRVVTLSGGVSAATPGAANPSAQTLVDMADEALYEAKAAGRNRVMVRDLDGGPAIPSRVVPNEA